jgi:hypothetical protein
MSMATESAQTACGEASPASVRPRRTLPRMAAFIGTAIGFAGFFLAAGAPTPLFVQYQSEWGFPSWLLTVAFAAYALALVVALLIAGGLSDIIGRRPVLIGAITVELGAMVFFLVAPNIGWVIAARIIQGLATGVATSAFTASLAEIAPPKYARLAAVFGGAAPTGGLGIGALLSGLAVQLDAGASQLVFTVLIVIMVLSGLVVIYSSETVNRSAGALRSLAPSATVPATARREFHGAIPVLIATWMFAALFLGLIPTIIRTIFSVDSGLVTGFTVFLAPGSATIAGFALARLAARRVSIIGSIAVSVGILVVAAAIVLHILPLVWVGAAIGGFGFGGSFSGVMRTLGPLADPAHRAGLFAAAFLVSYLSFGIPAIIAGQLIVPVGLLATVLGYGAVVLLSAVVGMALQLRIARFQ